MAIRSCRVTIKDLDGVTHSVEITAASLYEAVAQGLATFRGSEWVAGIAQNSTVVKVCVGEVRVEHEVKLNDFTKWLERNGGSPREMVDRQKIRAILSMPASR
jgi:mannitol-1-phosphate/altronate dehydrogenase